MENKPKSQPEGETDEHAIAAAKEIGILSGSPLRYFIQGWQSHSTPQPPSPQSERIKVKLSDPNHEIYSSLKDISIPQQWHQLWHEIKVWYGDINRKENAESLVKRLQEMIASEQSESAWETFEALNRATEFISELYNENEELKKRVAAYKRLQEAGDKIRGHQSKLLSEAKTVESEREANSILTDEVDKLKKENERLKALIKSAYKTGCQAGEGYYGERVSRQDIYDELFEDFKTENNL